MATLGLPATALAEPEHEIAPGESLTSIAAADGLSIAQLAAANGLSPTAELTAGVTLKIPPQTETATAAAGPRHPERAREHGSGRWLSRRSRRHPVGDRRPLRGRRSRVSPPRTD